jgi:hypothetical protein
MTNIIGVNNPYGLVQKAGKKRTHRRKKSLRKKHKKTRKNNRLFST